VIGGSGIPEVTTAGRSFYSAASYDNFNLGSSGLKRVFSEDEFSCCLPTGVQVDANTTDSMCCSGQRNSQNGVTSCCLNDFVNLSVYTNAYVSSEGVDYEGLNISEADIDENGFIDKDKVLQMASTMCCSGVAAYGVAINDYYKVIDGGQSVNREATTRRFLYNETLDDDNEVGNGISKFRAGLRWNNHVYCVPAELATGGTGSGSGTIQE
jgi:hypothetical protein